MKVVFALVVLALLVITPLRFGVPQGWLIAILAFGIVASIIWQSARCPSCKSLNTLKSTGIRDPAAFAKREYVCSTCSHRLWRTESDGGGGGGCAGGCGGSGG